MRTLLVVAAILATLPLSKVLLSPTPTSSYGTQVCSGGPEEPIPVPRRA